MSTDRTLGLAKVEIGPVGVGGGMGTVLTQITPIAPGTAFYNQAPDETTEFIPEDGTTPDMQSITRGLQTMAFSAWDVNNINIQFGVGGTVSGVDVWKSLSTAVAENKLSLKMTSAVQNGKETVVEIANGSMTGSVNLEMSKDNPGTVDYLATALVPTNGTTPAVKITQVTV